MAVRRTKLGLHGGPARNYSVAAKSLSTVVWKDLTNKRWLFTAANWSSDVRFYFEASLKAVSGTARARLYDVTRGEAVKLGEVSTTSTNYDTLRTQFLKLGDHVGSQLKAQGGTLSTHSGEVDGADVVMI